MINKVVFIVGSGRSGSTLLSFIIGSHPDCVNLGELDKFYRYYQQGKKLCTICRDDCPFWDGKFTELERKQLAAVLGNTRLNPYIPLKIDRAIRPWLGKRAILSPYSYLLSKRKESILFDSSKELDWVKERSSHQEFRSGRLKSYLLFIVRDGRAVMSSILRISPTWTTERFCQHWSTRISGAREFYDQFPLERKMIIRYEELVTNPHQTLKKLCDLLQIEFLDEMLSYWKYDDHHPVSGNTGTRSLIWRYRDQNENIQDKNYQKQGSHYDNVGLNLALDLRWKQELTPEQLEKFEDYCGEMNKPYEWD
ncbi:sulfotransferase [Roseofilum sp. Guam]|uniref:sulfotransferase n=1 Tax=Roseofilum sp. Guam TaxID=2821502 RepID=UPI001B271AA7|nr:sulfotransferase [Roseofilum sp. Guam]MBP0027328.1 sulfotransferase [Roseofilum sp. Guam]